jgi:flagellar motor switch protein FliG
LFHGNFWANVNMGEGDLQVLLRECAFDDWVVALKATHEPLKERIPADIAEAFGVEGG